MFAEKYANMSNEKNCMISKCKKVKKKDENFHSKIYLISFYAKANV